MATLSSLVVKLQADASGMTKELATARRDIERLTAQVRGMGTTTAQTFTTTTAATRRMTVATGDMARSLTRLREPLTSVTNGVLHLAPGVAQVSSILGTLAVGAPIMVGVLAGVAALSLAWKKLTEDTRNAKEALKSAREEADRIQKRQAGPNFDVAMAKAPIRTRMDEIGPQIERLQRLRAAGFAGEGTGNAKKLNELLAEQRGLAADLAALNAESARIMADQRDHAKGRLDTEYLTTAEMRKQYEWLQRINQQYKMSVPSMGERGMTATPWGSVIRTGDRVQLRTHSDGMTTPTGGIGFLNKLGNTNLGGILGGMAGGLASGMIWSVASKGIEVVTRALSALAGTSETAARRLALAQQVVAQSLNDMLVNLTGTDAQRSFISGRNQISEQIMALLNSGVIKTPQFSGSARDQAQQVAKWRMDLQGQLVGADSWAELRAIIESLKDLFMQTEAGQQAYNDAIALTTALQNEASNALRDFTDAVVNAARGFKVEAYRFNASTPMSWDEVKRQSARGGTSTSKYALGV